MGLNGIRASTKGDLLDSDKDCEVRLDVSQYLWNLLNVFYVKQTNVESTTLEQ